MKTKLIVALDYNNLNEAKSMIDILSNSVEYYKVGLELFLSTGFASVDYLKSKDKKVFLDLKFHDIPNTVAGAIAVSIRAGVDIFNLHTQGGVAMMREAKLVLDNEYDKMSSTIHTKPLLIGVTLLTSLNKSYLDDYSITVTDEAEYVSNLAYKAKQSGLDGVVSSASEVRTIKDRCGTDFITITPGIRMLDDNVNDQKRVVTPADAKLIGSDYIVVGRSITSAKDPLNAASKILIELKD